MQFLHISFLLSALILSTYGQQIESKFVTSADGAQIYAQAVGNKDLPHILLLHGGSLSTAAFDRLFANEDFTSKAYIVGYDTRGHGRSAKPPTLEGHSSSLYAADYAAVTKGFGLVNPLFVGWSLGGVISSDILEHIKPNPLAGIVYMNSWPALANLAEFNTPLSQSLIPGLGSQDNVTLNKAATVAFMDATLADPASVPFAVRTSWYGQATLQSPNQSVFVTTRPQNTSNLIAAGQSGFPTLFLNGMADKILQPEKVLASLQTWFTNITVNRIDHGPHAPFVENQTYVEQALLEFANVVHAG